jgi:Polyketide cyclase / dehydrase and lipid transport
MAHEFSGSAVIDRPIDQVFDFLADGTNDPKFSPRVQQIRQTTDGPPGVGTVFESTVKDAGMTTRRQFELTQFHAPTKIRWTERSKNMVTVPDGGYDLEPVSDNETKVTIHNVFEGHGFGKLVVGFAARAAVKDAPAFAQRIKSAVENSTPAEGDGPAPAAPASDAPPAPASDAPPAPASDAPPAPASDEPAAPASDEPEPPAPQAGS